MARGILERVGQRVIDGTPLKRMGGDEDLKGVVVFLASEAARHVSGQCIAVDGGFSIA
jgi:gluconate 5-dehydrogenase